MRRAVLLAAAAALLLAAPAVAQVRIAHVDASEYPRISVTVVAGVAAPPELREDGAPVAGAVAENLGRGKSVVLAVDRSQSMHGKSLRDAIAAARAFVAAKPPSDRIAVLAVGSEALRLTDFSSATIDADLALRGFEVDEVYGTALYDAVAIASEALARERFPARVLILLTDGEDVTSSSTFEEAIAAAREAGVAVYPVAIENASFSPGPLRRIAEETGGTYHAAASTAALSAVYGEIARELRRTWRVAYVTAARPGDTVRLESGQAAAPFVVPGPVREAQARPRPLLPSFALEGRWGGLLISGAVGGLVLGACVLAAGARRGSWLRTRLAPHVEHGRPRAPGKRRVDGEAFAAGAALLRATERAFGDLAVWRRVHRLLERADSPLRTVEFVYIALGCAFGLGLLAAVAGRSAVVTVLAMAAGGLLPFGVLLLRGRRRLKAFENQLPDLLLTLAASLKAGHSFKQGLQTVVDEGQPPASKEFTRVLAETRLGRPMEDALNEMAERVNSKNLEFVISAVVIQGQVGGSLAGLFDMVADAVRQRQQFARKIRGLTAMGRAAAYVLVGLPFFTAGVLTLLNAEFMSPLWETSAGHKLIGSGLAMMAIGSLMLKKIVSFRG